MDFLIVVFAWVLLACVIAWLVGGMIDYGMGEDD